MIHSIDLHEEKSFVWVSWLMFFWFNEIAFSTEIGIVFNEQLFGVSFGSFLKKQNIQRDWIRKKDCKTILNYRKNIPCQFQASVILPEIIHDLLRFFQSVSFSLTSHTFDILKIDLSPEFSHQKSTSTIFFQVLTC